MSAATKRRTFRAAVFDDNDSRSSKVAKVVPPKAKMAKIGSAVHGYWHDPVASSRRGDRQYDHGLGRIREIEAIIRHLFGSHIPDPRGTDDYDICVAYIRQAAFALVEGQDMTAWCRKWAPWADACVIADIETAASNRRQRTDRTTKADACGKDICLTWALRCKLGIKTIAAADMTAAESKIAARERKREHDRTRQEQRRKEEGMIDRESWLAQNSLSQEKPWESLNMSRKTWYRKGKPMPDTSVSRVQYTTEKGDTPVSPIHKAPQAVPPLPSFKTESVHAAELPLQPDAISLRSKSAGDRGRSSPPLLNNVDEGTTVKKKAG